MSDVHQTLDMLRTVHERSISEFGPSGAFQSAGMTVHAVSDERTADFAIDDEFSVEIGGPRKRRKRADFVIRDGVDWPAPGIVPLRSLEFPW